MSESYPSLATLQISDKMGQQQFVWLLTVEQTVSIGLKFAQMAHSVFGTNLDSPRYFLFYSRGGLTTDHSGYIVPLWVNLLILLTAIHKY